MSNFLDARRSQRGNLIGIVDIHGLYFESIFGASQLLLLAWS